MMYSTCVSAFIEFTLTLVLVAFIKRGAMMSVAMVMPSGVRLSISEVICSTVPMSCKEDGHNACMH